jgi:hypothetical protein
MRTAIALNINPFRPNQAPQQKKINNDLRGVKQAKHTELHPEIIRCDEAKSLHQRQRVGQIIYGVQYELKRLACERVGSGDAFPQERVLRLQAGKGVDCVHKGRMVSVHREVVDHKVDNVEHGKAPVNVSEIQTHEMEPKFWWWVGIQERRRTNAHEREKEGLGCRVRWFCAEGKEKEKKKTNKKWDNLFSIWFTKASFPVGKKSRKKKRLYQAFCEDSGKIRPALPTGPCETTVSRCRWARLPFVAEERRHPRSRL